MLSPLNLYLKTSRPPILAGIIAYSLFGAVAAGVQDPLKLALCLASSLLSACAVYSFNCFADLEEDEVNNPELPRLARKHATPLKALIVSSVIGSAAAALAVSVSTAVVSSLVTLIGFSYSLEFRGFKPKKHAVIKSASIGVGWALVAVVPFAATNSLGSPACATTFFFTATQVFIGATLRDFADVRGDRKAGVKSLPVVLGVKHTKKVLHAANALSAGGVAAAVAWFSAPHSTLALLGGWAWRHANISLVKQEGTPSWALREMNLGAGAAFAAALLAGKVLAGG
ncbi:MAG: UbiA family prenyltransferase [Candidatus Micrarchaeia archaeon]|jgi:4-hydroxybenzoate polyprenyltransferase